MENVNILPFTDILSLSISVFPSAQSLSYLPGYFTKSDKPWQLNNNVA